MVIAPGAYGATGGIAKVVRDIVEALSEFEWVEKIVASVRHREFNRYELPDRYTQLGPFPSKTMFAWRSAWAGFVSKPSLVICCHVNLLPIAWLVSRLSGAKLCVQLHGIEIHEEPSLFNRLMLQDAEVLLCVSRDTLRRVTASVDVQPERVSVLNNLVDDRFAPGDKSAARTRFKFDDRFLLLTVGRLSSEEQYKGHDQVIDLLSTLPTETQKSCHYVIAGDGDDRIRLELKVRQLRFESVVSFLGNVSDENLPDLFRAADLFVMPSSGEGFGIAFIEAMACGTPALGLGVGGASDALADGELGLCVSNEDFPAILKECLEQTRPLAGGHLAENTRSRFGREIFSKRLEMLVNG